MNFQLKNLDWKLNFAVLFLALASLVSLLGAKPELFWKQLIWWVVGITLIFLIIGFDWRPFINYRGVVLGIYFAVIALLLLTFLFAPTIRGTRGWLVLGSFQLQASEFAKISLIILYAIFFSRRHIGIARVSNLMVSFVYFIVPAVLVAIQPDFGSVLILFFIWFGFLLVSGIRWRHLALMLIIFAVSGLFMWHNVLKDYHKERILGMLFPARDALGINYSVIQSKIAIGSAGLFGKGFGQGTQVQLGFLPEAQTDFIFSAVVEEWGLIAASLLIVAFAVLLFRIIKVGLASNNNFNRFVCLGAAILFIAHFVLNVGSNLGLTPVIGVTFPFLSYGGSSLLTNLMLIGIIQSIKARG